MLLSTSIATYLHQFSPEETVDILAEAGFTALDFGFFNPRYYAKELDGHFFTELRKKAEDKGLVFNQAHAPFPSSVGKPERDEEIFGDIVRSMKNASLLGVKNIVVHPVQHLVYANDGVPEKLFELNVAFYNRLKPYCEEYGIRVAVENMWQDKRLIGRCDSCIGHSTCSTPEEFIRYMDALGDSRCFTACLDLGHTMLVHEKPEEFIRALGHDRLGALHVHDTDGKSDLHTLPYYGGMGYWDRITDALRDIDYVGDLTYEAGNFLEPLPKELYGAASRFMAEMGAYLIGRCGK